MFLNKNFKKFLIIYFIKLINKIILYKNIYNIKKHIKNFSYLKNKFLLYNKIK